MLRVPRLILLATASLTALFGQPPYHWSATGPLQVAREGACAAALPDGRILVAGGVGSGGVLRSVEIYQQDGTFLPAADMLRARMGHTCTTLLDGRVLVAGGLGEEPALPAEVFDPALDRWSPAEFGTERWNHTATLLPDGRVLLVGGETSRGASDLVEWFNPGTNRIRPLPGKLSAPRTYHASALLPDGSVLVSGGWNGLSFLNGVDVVKPDGSVHKAGDLPSARADHTATELNNGCVLIAGGLGVEGELKSALVYCADTAIFRAIPSLAVPRAGHLAFLLPNNGKVLITGGFIKGQPTAASELYDPAANLFLPAGSLTKARLWIAGAVDPTTSAVLAAGGYADGSPLAGCGILRGPTAAFDKARYVDGDAITVTGLGWTPGEKVNLRLSTAPFVPPGALSQILFQNFQTTASALGRIQQTLIIATAQSAGATYKVVATGVTSGLVATSSSVQVARTTVILNVSPFSPLTRQPVLLQAIIDRQALLDPLDGNVDFLTGNTPLGSVSSNGPVTNVTSTGVVADGTSNTILLGEAGPLPLTSSGFSRTFTPADGSVRSITAGGAFQLITRDLPAGTKVLGSTSPGSATASYSAFSSLYAPSSATATVSVRKRLVNLTTPSSFTVPPKVGDPITLEVQATAPQLPPADVLPTGNVHLTLDPGIVVNGPLSPLSFTGVAHSLFTVLLPAGVHSLSALYDGDSVYLPASVTVGTVTIDKGTVGFALTPGKLNYTVGEQITLSARISHPRVVGATPTGQISRTAGPTQFQGAAVGTDPGNTGIIDTSLPVVGFTAPGNLTVSMAYSGDTNFQSATASAILTVAKAVPQVTLIAPAQVTAGQEAIFTVRATAPGDLAFRPLVTGQVALVGIANGATANLVASSTSIATLRQTFPAAGTFSISAQYAGDTNFQSVTSAPVQVVVQ